MNDPDLLRRISNEAVAFDRAHFDDGIDPAPVTMVEHHLRLTTDRKLVTRLQPRFAVALGFFEGYAKAIEDSSKETRSLSRDSVLMDLSRTRDRISSLAAFANATEVRDTAAKFVQEAIDRISANGPKDAPEDRTRFVSWLREAFRSASPGSENAKNRDALIAFLNDPKNIGIVVKPPPPPPPPVVPPAPNELRTEIDDDLAQAAMRFANVDFGNLEFVDDPMRVRLALIRSDLAPWSDVVRGFVGGAQWQLARIENAHAGDEPTMHFPPAFDRPSMPSDEEIANLIRRTIYADRNFSEREARNIDEALDNDAESLRRLIGMRSGSIAEACAAKFALLHFFSSPNRAANERGDSERTQYETTIAQQKARIEELEREVASCKAAIDSPAPLVIRDESERDFWDEQVHALNRRGDRSPSDVAHAADEMVEERRKRMPSLTTNCAAISDELLSEAAAYANEFCEFKPDPTDLQNAKSAMNGNAVVELRWVNAVRSYVNGAIRKARET